MTSNAGHVFISHGSENRVQAQELSTFLEQNRIRTWIAPRDVRPGMDYSEQLQQAIEQCGAFAVLVSEKANKSPYVRAETEMAFSNNKPIFPVRMSDIMPAPGLALFLKIRHWTDAFGPDRDANLERLARELQAIAGAGGEAANPVTAAPAWSPPPAPAAAAQASPAAAATAGDEDKIRAVIGPNAPYYLDKWRRMDAKGSAISWNWPAFIVAVFWLAYRKLWLPMVGLLVAFILLQAIGAAGPGMTLLSNLLALALCVAVGAYGNQLYRKQVTKIVGGTDVSALDHRAGLDRLQLRGGTSTVAVVALALIFLVYASIVAVAQQAEVANLANASAEAADSAVEQSDTQGASEQAIDDVPADQGGKPPADENYPAEPYPEDY